MPKTYKVTFLVRASNLMAAGLVRLGLPMGLVHLLTVRGRKSGEPRTAPVAVIKYAGKRYLIATFGHVNWVRNLQAAGGEALLTRSLRREPIRAVEQPPAVAAEVLQYAMRHEGKIFMRNYFTSTPESSLEDFEREVSQHPVFLITQR